MTLFYSVSYVCFFGVEILFGYLSDCGHGTYFRDLYLTWSLGFAKRIVTQYKETALKYYIESKCTCLSAQLTNYKKRKVILF